MIINTLQKTITNVLTALYQPLGFAVILTVLFMFLYMFAKERGWKASFKQWWNSFKTDKSFRKVCLLVFYTAMILFRTLLCRYLWGNPLSNVIGVWGLYDDQGNFTTEAIENFVLFLPFIILLLWCFHDRIIGASNKFLATMWHSVKITFLFSLSIEFLQLILHLGTFQLSDVFYNTLGGFFGGLIYWIVRAVHNKVIGK